MKGKTKKMSIVVSNQASKSCISAKMMSAGVDHLMHGIGAIIMVLITEAMVVYEVLAVKHGTSLSVAFIMQIVAVYFVLYAIKHLAPVARKAEFTVCFSRLDDIVDIACIRAHYHVMIIDDYGVVFADNSDPKVIEDWLLVNKMSSTRRIERLLREVSE